MTTGIARSPFLDAESFADEQAQAPPRGVVEASWSPFLSVSETDEGEDQFEEGAREAYAALVNELYDTEFDEALFELETSARGMHQDHPDIPWPKPTVSSRSTSRS
jgi:hypothetical protein